MLENRNSEVADSVTLRGWFEMVVINPDGTVREVREVKNTVVNAGKAQVAGFINSAVSVTSSGVGAMRFLAIGSATSATGVADTTMGVEFSSNGGARLVATSLTRVTTSVTMTRFTIWTPLLCASRVSLGLMSRPSKLNELGTL